MWQGYDKDDIEKLFKTDWFSATFQRDEDFP